MNKKMLPRSLNKNRRTRGKRRRTKPLAEAFLASTHSAVRTVMAATQLLPDFRQSLDTLNDDDKLRLVEQALVLLEQNYVHLPLKENMHAVRPVQALKLLQQRLQASSGDLPDLEFHRTMIKIFTSVRDLHTNYILPAPYNQMTAYVPFLLEAYFDNGVRRYLLSQMVAGFDQPPFVPGVEITMWNGAPIDLAVAANSERFAGSNADARRARGIERMTIRPLAQSLPPDEDFVLVGYRSEDGSENEIRLNWLVFSPDPESGTADDSAVFNANNYAMGVDLDMHVAGLAKKCLFAPKVVAAEASAGLGKNRRKKRVATGEVIPGTMPGVMSAKTVDTAGGEFGYIRIHTFSVDSADDFVDEFIRLADLLPQRGLIIDVRSNGGGLIFAGELLLQLLTPRTIEPEHTQFINTALNLDLVRKHSPSPFNGFSLAEWRDSMEEAVGTGAVYSRGYPITDGDAANAIGQRYHGPVALITDAKCYSTTDIFAAGFQDHEIGPIIGIDGNTGAGGANVWTLQLLRQLAGPDSIYELLPDGANMRVAIRRTLRVGERSGTPVEDLGIQPDFIHEMTRTDLLDGNVDLIEFAASKLAGMPVRALKGQITSLLPPAGMWKLIFKPRA